MTRGLMLVQNNLAGLPPCADFAALARRVTKSRSLELHCCPSNDVLSVVPTKNPFGWSGLMPIKN
jgi:hypothetical protein